mmetsp:Transcript_22287/g.59004  ORF Transcript_22287/g.59004 Transcript_22287/m.59004 type:complete len:331 (+) Transcript_22287:2108-3100(+)
MPVNVEPKYLALGLVRVAVNSVCAQPVGGCWQHHANATHLVGGQCARLVGTDDSGATKSFHGRELPDYGVSLCHLSGTECQASGDHCGQALWDRCHSQCNGDLEVVDAPPQERTMDRVEEMLVVYGPNQSTNDKDYLCEQLPKFVKFSLQRGLLLVLRRSLNRRLNLSNLSGHTRPNHNSDNLAIGHSRGAEEHVRFPLNDVRFNLLHHFRHALGLASELRLLDSHRGCLQLNDAQVRWNLVSDTNLTDIARHQIDCFDGLPAPIPQYQGCVGLELLQGIQGLLRVGFLPHSHNGVGNENQQNDKGLNVCSPPLYMIGIVQVSKEKRHHR